MGSDDEELAELRAQRASRMGGSAGLAALREQQRRAESAAAKASEFYEGAAPSSSAREEQLQGSSAPPQRPQGAPQLRGRDDDGDEDDEDGPVVVVDDIEADAAANEQLRFMLPMSFGAQEEAAVRLEDTHNKFKRPNPSVGPPRPPGFGPPRPPGGKAGALGAGAGAGASAAGAGAGASGSAGPGGGERAGPAGEAAGEAAGDAEGDAVGPPRPPAEDGEEEEDDEEDGGGGGGGGYMGGEGDEGDDPWLLPVSHEVSLVGHTRAVTALDIDHSGTRAVSGGMDYMVRIYDFNGMKKDMRPFRELEPQEGHPVHAVSWSPTGDAFIAITGSSKAKVYDRDGHTRGEFVRGDMYIRDMKNTKGHVSGLCGGQWHPTDRFTAMTCSEDGTVRIWDTHNILQKTVIKPTLQKPVRTSVTACRYGLDGKLIAAGLHDGSIQLWSVSGKFGSSAAVGQVLPPAPQMVEKQGWTYVSRPNQVVRSAHRASEDITSLAFSRDGHTLLSRSLDATMKIWDLRKFTQPVRVFGDLPCQNANTMAIFSPDEQLVLTGVTTGNSADEMGALVIYDKAKGELVRRMGMPGTVTALAWHPRINQIFVGAGNRRLGATRVLYSPSFSERGVMVAASRVPRKPDPADWTPPLLVKEYDPNRKRRRKDQEVHPTKVRCPDPGMSAGVGRQGRIGTSTKTLLTQHIMKTKGKLIAVDESQDPREALLKHADKDDEFSSFTAAYAKTQPKPIFAQEEEEEEEGA